MLLKGMKHPMKATKDGTFVPNFSDRYLTEDLPYGIVVLKGIALVVGVETPTMDKVRILRSSTSYSGILNALSARIFTQMSVKA